MRRLKSINVYFDPTSTSISEIEKIPNLKELVYGELYSALSEIKKEKNNTVQLFELNNSGYIVELSKNDWVPALEQAINFYEKSEEYEKCLTYKKLINQIYEQRNRPNSSSNKQPIKRKNSIKKEKNKKSITR